MGKFSWTDTVPLIGSAMDAIFQGGMNRKSRKWAEKMYGVQRSDALADWYRQTEYDSPQAQMARLRDAKLNPNLVYGDSVVQSSPSVRSSSNPGWNPQAARPGHGFQASLMAHYETRLKEAQTNNLEASTTTQVEEAQLKRAQMFATLAGTDTTKFDLAMKQRLAEIYADSAKVMLEQNKANLKRTGVDIQVMLDSNERAAVKNVSDLKEAAARILHMRYQNAKTEDERKEIQHRIQLIDADKAIKEEEKKLYQNGVRPGDPLWQRKLSEIVNKGINLIKRIKAPGKMTFGRWLEGARSQ